MAEALTTDAWTEELKTELSERTRALAESHPLYRGAPATV
jgi:hypothetical protein